MNDFKEISPYNDNEVPEVIERLINNPVFLSRLSPFFFPRVSFLFPYLGRVLFKMKFNNYFGASKSIKDFQNNLAPFVGKMIENTTQGFTVSGKENLLNKPSLFIGNHRDISMDAAFLNYALYLNDTKTARIAIGDNLLDRGYAEDLMRLNKSFVVHRNIEGVKETFRKLQRLSSYIYKSVTQDLESIWIAQREGRANDGNDSTDIAVLKMLFLSTRKSLKLNEWLENINLTPVVISYEYDPLDITKATGRKGWKKSEKKLNNTRDINELIKGITGYKGRVHLHICKPIKGNVSSIEQLVEEIDISILSNYKLWPTNHFSVSELAKENKEYKYLVEEIINSEEASKFMLRFVNTERLVLNKILKAYAFPVLNKKRLG